MIKRGVDKYLNQQTCSPWHSHLRQKRILPEGGDLFSFIDGLFTSSTIPEMIYDLHSFEIMRWIAYK